jgi:lipopolysaccharide export system protein LptA
VAIWSGAVEALQDRDRMHADVLKIYFEGKPSAGKSSSGGAGAAVPANWGKVMRMEAEGHVFFVTPTQTARGDHAIYVQGSNSVTITGDVIVAQGQSVVHGDRLVIDTKTNHATMVSTGASGGPARVRGIFFPNQSDNTGAPAPPPSRNP